MAFQKFNTTLIQSKKLTFVFRILLGGTLFVFGVSKLPNLAGFADTVVKYKVLPESLAVPYGYGLPFAEVVVGLFLILGLGLRFVAPIAILLIASFIAATTGALYVLKTRGPCDCRPGFDWDLGISHIIAEIFMLIMAAQIWFHKGEFWSLDKRLFGRE